MGAQRRLKSGSVPAVEGYYVVQQAPATAGQAACKSSERSRVFPMGLTMVKSAPATRSVFFGKIRRARPAWRDRHSTVPIIAVGEFGF